MAKKDIITRFVPKKEIRGRQSTPAQAARAEKNGKPRIPTERIKGKEPQPIVRRIRIHE